MDISGELLLTLNPFKHLNHIFRDRAGDEEHHQPADPATHRLGDPALPIRFLVGLGVLGDTAEREDVLGLFAPENIERVVVGDDPQKHILRVDDGNGDQVVLANLAGDAFLILVDPSDDHVALHDVLDLGRGAREDQSLERNEADEVTLIVDNVTVIDGLAVGGFVAKVFEGLADVDVARQGDVVGRHRRAGGPRLVACEPPEVVALGLREKNLVDAVLVEPIDEPGPLVVWH